MSRDYEKLEAVLDFEQMKKTLSGEVITVILEKLRSKNKGKKSDGATSEEFNLMVDVGCGSGKTIKFFVPYFKSITAFDPSNAQINLAKKSHPFDNVTYHIASGEEMPVLDNSVDLATFIFSAFYMNMEKLEKELIRVLKPNGLAVFYGDIVSGIDLVKNNFNDLDFPELRSDVKKLWLSCLKKFEDYANEINHPDWNHLNKLEKLCQKLKILNKSRDDSYEFSEASSLGNFLTSYYSVIPFYSSAIKAMDVNPLEKFVNDLRKLWNISEDADDKDIKVKITKSAYFIFLDKTE